MLKLINDTILFIFGKEWYVNKIRKHGTKVGKNTYMSGVKVDSFVPDLVSIGDNCIITEGCVLLAHDRSPNVIGRPTFVAPLKIGNNVFIGVNSVLLPDVIIGDNTIIGAGSVVTKSFPDGNCVIAGNPAKKIGELDG